MTGKVLFAQVLHCHQPVGNFDSVFEMACEKAYLPYVEEYLRTGRMAINMHYSGSLLDWLETHKHPLIDRLRDAARSCPVEFVGGGAFEPILPMLPRRDALGQVRGGSDQLERLFGKRPRGAWITERVWEQNLASLLAEAGIEYACLDDSHFGHAGMDIDQLGAYYLAEDQGKTVGIFPASERLRYLIPFGTIEQVIEELRRHRPQEGLTLVVYADDGEKFGLWPGTSKHVYADGWLARFHQAIAAEADWLEPVTLSSAFDRIAPSGLAYLGDDSYREMTEWVLPAPALAEFLRLNKELANDGRFQRLKRFIRGGTWRAFKAKYAELARMYARMLQVSEQVNALPAKAPATARARRELYQAQCNCAWWHGVFGGLYLAHLRGAVWKHLLAAERIARAASRRKPVAVQLGDFDMDSQQDVRLLTDKLSAFVAPERGGHVYEIDLLAADENLCDVLTRRYEAYHEDVKEALARGVQKSDGQISIHDLQRVATSDHANHMVYDREVRESFVEHIATGDWRVENLWSGGLPSDDGFRAGPYDIIEKPASGSGKRGKAAASVCMTRTGSVRGAGVLAIEKTVRVPDGRAAVGALYRLSNRGSETLEFTLVVEVNLCPDFKLPPGGQQRGPEVVFYNDGSQLALPCPDRRLHGKLTAAGAAAAAWQIKTVSQSESGYEIGIQGLCVQAWWPVRLAPGKTFEKELELAFARE